MVTIKVTNPVKVPVSALSELIDLRARVAFLERENERLHHENERLQNELDQARAALAQSERRSKRQSAPFSKGPPKPHPKPPGRKSGAAHGRHGHRLPPLPGTIDVVLEASLPDACPH